MRGSGAGGAGGRVNTDALDNSAGVSTSDREVNIKILLADAEREGRADPAPARRPAGRDDGRGFCALVLRDNQPAVARGVARDAGRPSRDLGSHAALIAMLEAEGTLDRAVAGLPNAAALQALCRRQGRRLLRPEVAALLPAVKLLADRRGRGRGRRTRTSPPTRRSPPSLLAYFPRPAAGSGFARFAAATPAAARADRHGHRQHRREPASARRRSGRLALEAGPVRIARAAWLAGALLDLEATVRRDRRGPGRRGGAA